MPVFRSFFRALMRSVCDFVGVDYCSAKDYKSDYKSSISSKSKCALRAVIAFFVASATLIATFVVAPSSALSASQDGAQQNVERSTNAQNNVQQSGAQNNSAQNGINKDEVKRQVNSYEPPNSPEPPNSYGNAYGSIVMADGSNRDNKKEDAHGSDNASSKDKNKVDANVSNKVDNNNNIDNASKDDEKLNNGVKRNGKAFNKASNSNNKDDSNKDNSNKDDSNKAGDSAKLDNKLEKSAKHRRVKRALSGEEGNEPWRPALEACQQRGGKTFAKCYHFKATSPDQIDKDKYVLDYSDRIYYIPLYFGRTYSFDSKLAYAYTYDEVPIPYGTKFKITNIVLYNYKNRTDSAIMQDWVSIDNNARITIHATSKWIVPFEYRANIEIEYPDGSTGKDHFEFIHDDLGIRNHDLNINVYNNQNIDEHDRNYGSVTLKKKRDGTYDSLNMLIDSMSKRGPGTIKHRMLCHKDSDTNYDFNSYSLDGIAGLKLKPFNNSTSSGENSLNQLEWQTHPGENRASGAKNSGEELYEDDDYTERSQSLFTGTPDANSDGDYTCRIFAIKNNNGADEQYLQDLDHLIFTKYVGRQKKNGKKERIELITKRENSRKKFVEDLFKNTSGTFLKERIFSKSPLLFYLKGLHVDILPGDPGYNGFIYDGYTQSVYSYFRHGFQTIDWDYKTLKIHIGKDNPPSDNTGDLSLKVYSSKRQNNFSSEASSKELIDSNSGINVMNGIKFSTFINATSVNDNSKIKLKTLCAKGEYAGKTSSDSDNDASENIFEQSYGGLIYQHWKDDFLDVSSQKSCTSNKSGLKTCDDGKFGAQTTADAEGKPLQMSEHKCVVYALKPKALEEFKKITTNITPDKVDYALAAASLVEAKDYAKFTFPIHIRFSLPNTGERNWNLQLGAIAAVMVSVLAAAFILNHLNWQRGQAALRKAAVPM